MKRKMINKVKIAGLFLITILLYTSCGDEKHPGYEFMPNMYRSPSIETYEENNIKNYSGIPVEGTIPRGYLSSFRDAKGIKYGKSDEDYLRAGDEITYPENIHELDLYGNITSVPFVKNDLTLNEGKILYDMMCAHCHGETGLGDGPVTKTKNPAYSAEVNAIPAYNDASGLRRTGLPMNQLKEGHIFHAITYGLNAMGQHASQLTETERWKIIYYIQEELQTYGSE